MTTVLGLIWFGRRSAFAPVLVKADLPKRNENKRCFSALTCPVVAVAMAITCFTPEDMVDLISDQRGLVP